MCKRKSKIEKTLDRLAVKYRFASYSRKADFWWKIYQVVGDFLKAEELTIHSGDFDYLKLLAENDGPEQFATVVLQVNSTAFYEMGICIRGNPIFKKLKVHKIESIKQNMCDAPMKYATEDVINAHEYCSHNKDDLQQKQKCGCFYCLSIFQSDEIVNYVADEPIATAVCPYCNIDAVIGESSGYPIETVFLNCMNEYWF